MNIVSLGGFAAARSLSTGFSETPAQASRPFDLSRDGFVMGEGAGILVVEKLSHALARGATPLTELVGYGTTADAHHIRSRGRRRRAPRHGDRDRSGAYCSARCRPSQCTRDLHAHRGSGEIEAIKSVFGRVSTVAVSATKSATGHLLGAAGGLGAIFTVLALRDQVAPPTLNLSAPDPAADGIDFVANEARPMATEYAIANGFGFGGVNASALFRRWHVQSAGANAGSGDD